MRLQSHSVKKVAKNDKIFVRKLISTFFLVHQYCNKLCLDMYRNIFTFALILSYSGYDGKIKLSLEYTGIQDWAW